MTSGKICNPQGTLCGLGVVTMMGCTEDHLHIFNTGQTWPDMDKTPHGHKICPHEKTLYCAWKATIRWHRNLP